MSQIGGVCEVMCVYISVFRAVEVASILSVHVAAAVT